MSKLSEFVKYATTNKSNHKAPKTCLNVRIDKALKAEAMAVFGNKVGQLVTAAIQDALEQVKGSKS